MATARGPRSGAERTGASAAFPGARAAATFPAVVAEEAVTYASPVGGPDVTLVGRAGDEGVLGQLRRSGGDYEADINAVLRRRVRRGDVVLDVGANIGPVTLVMSRLVGEAGTVVAFEPARENVDFLQRNLAANGAVNVTVVDAAASDHVGTVGFEFNEAYPAGSFVSDDATETVRSTTIDAIVDDLALRRVDLVKVDVEGAEVEALRGAMTTIGRYAPDLVVELNPIVLARFHRVRWRDLVEVLRTASDDLRLIEAGGHMAPLRSERHVELELAERGVIDLIAIGASRPLADRRGLRTRVRAASRFARSSLRHQRWRCPEIDYISEPAVGLDVRAKSVRGAPGADVGLRVTVANLGSTWFSSDFTYHPVHVGARWLDASGTVIAEASRARFARPLGPGKSTTVDLRVSLPDDPGEHHLAISLVQEHFAWFDDLDGAARLVVPAFVP